MQPDEFSIAERIFGRPLPDAIPQEHQHCFVFELSRDAALRGCESCGRTWIAPRLGHALWGSWQEIKEQSNQ